MDNIKMAVKDVSKGVGHWNAHTLLVGMWDGTATLEKAFGQSLRKLMYTYTDRTTQEVHFWVFTQQKDIIRPQKRLYMSVHSRSIHDSPNWRQLKSPSVSKWRNKLWSTHLTEFYSAVARSKLLKQTTIQILKNTTWANEARPQHTLYDSIYTKL